MLNFLTNVFQEKANAKNTCSPDMDVIQACIGCDADCLYFCHTMCASECQGNSQAGGGGGCNSHCNGTCFSVASIIGIK